MAKKRYVQVGTGGRARFFYDALTTTYTETAELCAFCDINRTRLEYAQNRIMENAGYRKVPLYGADEFDKMIEEQKPDVVIVTSIDRTHHKYIIRAMELGCDVISEKPMTTNEVKCQQIIDTVKKTGKHLRVSFNYRYAPHNSKVRELIKEGVIGDVKAVHFEWMLNTKHGADYFRRWHRDKRNSGGLLVHKSTHHFDLVNWWMDSEPESVFAMGALRFYGRANAESRGIDYRYFRTRNVPAAADDPFRYYGPQDPHWKDVFDNIYFGSEGEDDYFRDLNVFSDGISIEDNMGVMVRYKNKAILTYSLNAHAPWEGYRVTFNGTKGRLEVNAVEVSSYKNRTTQEYAPCDYPGARLLDSSRGDLAPEILFQPHWGQPWIIDYPEVEADADHGGGDELILQHLFRGVKDDPLGHAANNIDGAKSILIGIAGNESMRTGLPVKVESLVKF